MAVIMPLDDGEEIPAAAGSLLQDEDFAQASSSSSVLDTGTSSAGDVPITLAFDDLLPDANGEIVVMGADLGTQLSIMTDQRICAEGVADSHLTVDGLDVAGLAYFAFEGGMRLYYSPEIEVTIAPVHG